MVTSLVPGAVEVLLQFGTPAQQARHIPAMASGETLATMALTEPGAGSDLAAIRNRAVRDGEGWRISGEKIFISGGIRTFPRVSFTWCWPGLVTLTVARAGFRCFSAPPKMAASR